MDYTPAQGYLYVRDIFEVIIAGRSTLSDVDLELPSPLFEIPFRVDQILHYTEVQQLTPTYSSPTGSLDLVHRYDGSESVRQLLQTHLRDFFTLCTRNISIANSL